jgi:hypothetical protein
MSEAAQHATSDERAIAAAGWRALGMPWRTEPEIDAQRQAYLNVRRAVTPNIERGIYAFRDANSRIILARADVEWLLATLESGGYRGPVDWSDEKQCGRAGLDLRGADLHETDLNHLPLTRRGGPTAEEWRQVGLQKSQLAALRVERADLYGTQLQGADLRRAHLTSDLAPTCPEGLISC